MKKLTLDETWRLCLSMWRWIAKQKKEGVGTNVDNLKHEWLAKHYPRYVQNNCFFCGYAAVFCPKCPGRLVDESFLCDNTEYSYFGKPIKFYNKLVSLNRKRLKAIAEAKK